MIEKLNNNKAFTLIELIVVVGIIGVLVGIASPRFNGFSKDATVAAMKTDTEVLETAAMIYQVENEGWPTDKDISQPVLPKELKEIIGEVSVEHISKSLKKDNIKSLKNKLVDYAIITSKGKYEGDVIHLKGVKDKKNVTHYNARISTGSAGAEEPKSETDILIEEGYIPISTASDFSNISSGHENVFGKGSEWEGLYTSGLDKKYIQVADIDFSDVENFLPIGHKDSDTSVATHFKGTFDGGGFTIKNLTSNHPNKNHVGLFSRTSNATISNVGLINANMTGKMFVGALIGSQNNSKTSNSYSTGNIKGNEDYVGGLVGEDYRSSITDSYSNAVVTGDESSVGGLVGVQEAGKTTRSYATGNVFGGASLGGLIGQLNRTKVVDSYSTGDVTGTIRFAGTRNIGGLVGQTNAGEIRNSYAVGNVTGDDKLGGLIGDDFSNPPTVVNSYYNKEVSGLEDNFGAIGKTTLELKSKSTYEGWDFETTWEISDGYPTFQ